MNRITWTAFFAFLSFIVIVYYITVVVIYYRKTLPLFLLNKVLRLPPAFARTSAQDAATPDASITDLIRQAATEGYTKEAILLSLHTLLHDVEPARVSEPSYRTSINNRIVDDCRRYCSIHLSEEDLRMLWNRMDGAL